MFSKPTILARQKRLAEVLDKKLQADEIVIFFAGDTIQKPGGLDQHYDFLPYPEYYWLTGLRRPGGLICYSTQNGWKEFIIPISVSEVLWEGPQNDLTGEPVSGFENWLGKQKFKNVYTIGVSRHIYVSQSSSTEKFTDIMETINKVRRIKDYEEIDLIRRCASVAVLGYAKLEEFIEPGVSEREIRVAYESEVLSNGADKMPYSTIVGAGTNSAILHALPTGRTVKDGDHILIDAGVDIADYCVDITRIFSVTNSLNSRQKAIYNIVAKAQAAGIKTCKPGVYWSEVHKTAAEVITEGLHELGILKGDLGDAIESEVVKWFFPHGVGHMVGHRVRDVGHTFAKPPSTVKGISLRVDISIEVGMVFTVEPGLYFVPPLLEQGKSDRLFKRVVNQNELDKWLDFGGVRLEDDILIQSGEPQNLTAKIPH